jgi:Ca-activated chloride channel family protein
MEGVQWSRRIGIVALCLGTGLLAAGVAQSGPPAATPGVGTVWLNLFLTPDQQGQRLFDRGAFAAAAERFSDPERIAAALYRAGKFEQAADSWGRSATPEAAYNRGNALVFLGRYEAAIDSYRRALAQRPDWLEARNNLELAALRKARLAPPEDDYGGTGGMLGADEIVMDSSGRVAQSGSEQVLEAETGALDDEALRTLWLRRVDTRPGDFLAIRFAHQLAREADTGTRPDSSARPEAPREATP